MTRKRATSPPKGSTKKRLVDYSSSEDEDSTSVPLDLSVRSFTLPFSDSTTPTPKPSKLTGQDGGAVTTRSMLRAQGASKQQSAPPSEQPLDLSIHQPLSSDQPLDLTIQQPPPIPPPTSHPTPSAQASSVEDWRTSPAGPSHQSTSHDPPSSSSKDAPSESNAPSQVLDESNDSDGSSSASSSASPRRVRRRKQYLFEYDPTPPKIFKRNSARSFKAKPIHPGRIYNKEIAKFHSQLASFLKRERSRRYPRGMKVHVGMKVKYEVIKNGVVVDTPEFIFTSKSEEILRSDDISQIIGSPLARLEESIADQQDRGSGYVFHSILYFHVTLARHTPLVGGNYIRSPVWLSQKKATVNVQTKDGKCIIDCINAQLHPAKENKHRPSHYAQYRAQIKTEGVNFPAGARDMDRLEKLNPHLSLNIYAFELIGKKKGKQAAIFYPYRISKNRGDDKVVVNLLLLEDEKTPSKPEEEKASSKRHYVLITDLARLTSASNSAHKEKSYACPYCLRHFSQEHLLADHNILCRDFKPSATRFPEEGKDDRLKFEEFGKQHPAKYFAVFDAETREVKRNGPDQQPEYALPPEEPRKYPWVTFPSEATHVETCRQCKTLKPCQKIRSSTQTDCTLEPFSFGFKVISTDGPEHDLPLRIYQGPDCAKMFIRMLKEDMTTVHEILNRKVPIRMTSEDWKRHRASKRCNICKEAYTASNVKVRDHDHTILHGPNYRLVRLHCCSCLCQ